MQFKVFVKQKRVPNSFPLSIPLLNSFSITKRQYRELKPFQNPYVKLNYPST